MLILLAPSEGKTGPQGPPADLEALAFGALNPKRRLLAERLGRLAEGSPKRALAALGLSPGQADEAQRNRDLLSAPAGAAGEVYTGVLYQHLDLPSLRGATVARAGERLFVASALWGVISIEDRIPAYRLGMTARLPRLGSLAAWWRPALTAALPADAFVVDLRSGAYAAAWRPASGTVVEVRAFTGRGASRKPISHMAKAVRGEVARALVERGAAARTPQDVAATVEAAGERVELVAPARPGAPWAVEVSR